MLPCIAPIVFYPFIIFVLFPFCSAMADGILTDNPHLVLLFYMAQLFLRELVKSYRLIQVVPMDMSGYYGKFNATPTHDSVFPGQLGPCFSCRHSDCGSLRILQMPAKAESQRKSLANRV